ncbi:MAG: TatD family hydrolase [Candidatus Spechtbacteria bacterium]|nr:TatD family hydrolase [Candidatus Spechtbacteria bacterium]
MPEFTPQFIDTHGHVNFNAFKDDGGAVIQRALDNGVGIVMPGSQIDTSRRAVEYAERWDHPYIRAAIGLHPIHLEDIQVDESEVEGQIKFHTRKEKFARAQYESLLKSSDKIVAIGEVGLDYWRLPEDPSKKEQYKKLQIDTLISQLDLALDYKNPVIVHCRKAHDDLFSIIANHGITRALTPPGVVHCYTGNKSQLKSFLELGWFIGYNGIIFKMNLEDVIKATPLERILLETDSPYLTPPLPAGALPLALHSFSGGAAKEGRNEPRFVKHVAERVAEIKQISFDEVARQTTENAKRVFRLGN